MDTLKLYSPEIVSTKSVSPTIVELASTYLECVNYKLEDEENLFLAAQIHLIKYLKTGTALEKPDVVCIETNLSELPENSPILAIWHSAWFCENQDCYTVASEKGTRIDDLILIDANILEEACESNNPHLYHLDYYGIEDVEGSFSSIGLPDEGYEAYVERVLSYLDFSRYDDVDEEYHSFAHPIIREFLDEQFDRFRDAGNER